MKSLNKTNEAWPGVTRVIINISLKHWIENEEKLLSNKETNICGEHAMCQACVAASVSL